MNFLLRNNSSVAKLSQLIVACNVTAEANDKQQAVPRAQRTVAQLAQAGIKTPKERMAAKIQSPAGRAPYARRKVIVKPVFRQIKEARGFRRFLLRGLDNIRGEWRLVCLTHNLLKIWRYTWAPITV